MSLVGPPPRGTVLLENVSNLQLGAGHRSHRLLQPSPDRMILQVREHLIGAYGIFDRLCRDMGVLGRQSSVWRGPEAPV